jgi:PDZ domain-containing protein
MMFALGIIDKLTTLNLTGGKFIAGTGEITANGQVQAIGGIQQKMWAPATRARRSSWPPPPTAPTSTGPSRPACG